MRIQLIILCGFLALLLKGCVSNQEISYLRNERDEEKETIVTDSVVRVVESGVAYNTVQPFDQILIEVKTITPLEYNPFSYVESSNTGSALNSTRNSDDGSLLGYNIDADGYVKVPLLGNVKLGGLGFTQAEDSLERWFSQYISDPIVRVKLSNFKYTVLGEVVRPGSYGSYNRRVSVLQGMAKAGGAQEFGDLSRVKLIREQGGQTMVVYLNLNDEDFLQSQYFYLKQDDVLVIFPLENRPTLAYVQKNVSIVASITAVLVSIVTLIVVNRR